jgi:hypothetical protein
MSSAGKLFLPWGIPLVLIALAGCGDGPRIVNVTGTLTYKGKPVTNAFLHFLPEHGRQSWAETDDHGRFKVNYDRHQDGAVVGKHKVWVEMRPTTREQKEAVMSGKALSLSKDMRAFFDKYSQEKSTLEVQIDRSRSDLNLDLD